MLIEYTKNGRRRTVNAKVGKFLIGRGVAREVSPEPAQGGLVGSAPAGLIGEAGSTTYSTRMMQAGGPALQADTPENTVEAPYGYKADGTPRKRPAPVRKKADD